jgi:hypothetical protein
MTENWTGDLSIVLMITGGFLWLAVYATNLERELEACKAKLEQREVIQND